MDIATIVLSISGIAGGGGTIAYWLETRSGRAQRRKVADAKALIDTTIAPVRDDITTLKTKVESDGSHVAGVIKLALYEALDPIKNDVSTLKANTASMWNTLEKLAVAFAEQIHKPHQENAELDRLLEEYINWVHRDGPFPPEHELKLRSYLKIMKNWKPGQQAGFVVDPEDPTRAAGLLAMMELTRLRRQQEQQ